MTLQQNLAYPIRLAHDRPKMADCGSDQDRREAETAGIAELRCGVAKVEPDKSGKRRYGLDYEYKAADRYNWDMGKPVEIFGVTITDKFMGEVHRRGLAKEFDMVGSIKAAIDRKRRSKF